MTRLDDGGGVAVFGNSVVAVAVVDGALKTTGTGDCRRTIDRPNAHETSRAHNSLTDTGVAVDSFGLGVVAGCVIADDFLVGE
jgi:hypothetical protein